VELFTKSQVRFLTLTLTRSANVEKTAICGRLCLSSVLLFSFHRSQTPRQKLSSPLIVFKKPSAKYVERLYAVLAARFFIAPHPAKYASVAEMRHECGCHLAQLGD